MILPLQNDNKCKEMSVPLSLHLETSSKMWQMEDLLHNKLEPINASQIKICQGGDLGACTKIINDCLLNNDENVTRCERNNVLLLVITPFRVCLACQTNKQDKV